MIRELVSRLSRVFAEKKAPARKQFNVPVKVCFAAVKSPVKVHGGREDQFLSGETCDLSDTGIGFEVSAIRIKEKYLVGQERLLNVELDVSGAKIRMQVKGVRYERVGIHLSTERYVVGAEIVKMDEDDRAAYEQLLKHGYKSKASLTKMVKVGIE